MINLDLLNAIPPDCSYDEWIRVGMALKHEGAACDVWDAWSSAGSKYKPGECQRKWNSFRRNDVTGGTLYHIACEYGYRPEMEPEPEYDLHNLLLDEIIVDPTFVSAQKVPGPPHNYNPKGDTLEYLKALFKPEDHVGYCVKFRLDQDGRWKPADTVFRRTAGHIIEALESGSDAFGTMTEEAGAYVRFNPLDGQGENNANVTRWKYCLIESDVDSIEKQYALFKEMNLPIRFLVHSGGHSLHAITKVDAENAQQYRQRVTELYDFCKKNGLTPDEADKNESRFSRLPGVKRGENWQYIVEREIGAASYDEWIQWREEQADDLPKEVDLAEAFKDLPPLKPELIPGILRVGHKLLLAGPSKAGKSFFLMNLAVSIAEGVEWIGLDCRKGRVCYVNMELDEASCLHRFRDIYQKRGIAPEHAQDLTVWNLRGHATGMDRLAPILIHRFKERKYDAIIIDPIYKVITGDENNATDMGKFCSYFDRVATELGVSMIYCHHHSKGATGKYANAADRSSGSGVFARDPDAIIDMRELNVDGITDKYHDDHPDANMTLTGWEIDCTLREFRPRAPMRVWFDYPMHVPDPENYLAIATYGESAQAGDGVGKGQTSRADWFKIVEDMIAVSTDTAVSLEAIGINESNAKKQFSKESPYEVATVDGVKVAHRRDENQLTFLDKKYIRHYQGKTPNWKPI